ncbi:hypothetical protein [Halomonas lysinitropha]|uniref:Uncharacterized protein n=1 Tax=Halomonas lysinitropha TaxID=2607506 RepID=A0A5K1I8V8_9GAMM|nr:hypothetical protein [Halomonas lysinitropha]VVZ96488.1 hypothetical protein HALO32_02588 [Halomonas lysinitropha]
MTEANHQLEDQAWALVDDVRFCEWLDSSISTARSNSWQHSRYTARRWLEEQCGIESLGHLATDPEAATAFDQIARAFALWDRNQELAL